MYEDPIVRLMFIKNSTNVQSNRYKLESNKKVKYRSITLHFNNTLTQFIDFNKLTYKLESNKKVNYRNTQLSVYTLTILTRFMNFNKLTYELKSNIFVKPHSWYAELPC
eukprot:SAG31_NODE_5402_length_2557_cov_4.867372_2_plen_109_part_00